MLLELFGMIDLLDLFPGDPHLTELHYAVASRRPVSCGYLLKVT